MLKMKTPNIPIHLPNRFYVSKKIDPPLLTSPSMGPVIPDVIPAEPAPNEKSISSSLPASIKSDNAANQPNANKVPKLPVDVQGSVKDELFALLHGAYQKSVSSASTQKSQKPLKTTTNPDIIQSNELERQKNLFLLISGRAEETISVKPVYTAKSNHAESRTASTSVRPAGKILPDGKGQSSSTTTGIPPEYDDLAKLVSSLPEGFDLTGWDDKSTREQRSAMQKSGLSSQAQMQLLNASTSIETIAIVQDIQRNRVAYGLSAAEVNEIAEQLFDISNARIGAKNHAMPFSENAKATNTFLTMLQEKEDSLLSSLGFGIHSIDGKRESVNRVRNEITDLISGDSSVSDVIHNSPDVFSAADDFFSDMTKLDHLISEVENGNIAFRNAAEKQRYLDYLTSEYDKNNQLYRRQLSSVIDEAKLLEYPETRFKKLINDLSLSQLAVFVDQIDQFGVKKLSKAGGYEKLMRNLLSDQESALSISADETESPIRPCVWLGIDTVKEKEMAISGYYYRNGHYYTQISKAGKSYNIDLGSKIPSEVAVEAKQTTAWDMFGDQIRLFMELCTTPAFVLDTAYYAAVYFGVPAFLPAGLSPSDLPYLNELLEEIDPWAHTAHIKKETVILRIVTHHLNTSENELHVVQFDTYHAE